MKKALSIVIVFISIVSFSGCYYDKEDVVYPNSKCDTANMKYTTSVQNIIQTHCYVCHGGDASGSFGINLDSYTALHEHAADGHLVERITSTDPSFMMPRGGPRLSDCEIAKIEAWVNNGAPN